MGEEGHDLREEVKILEEKAHGHPEQREPIGS